MQGYSHTSTLDSGRLIALLFVGLFYSHRQLRLLGLLLTLGLFLPHTAQALAPTQGDDKTSGVSDFNTPWVCDSQPDSLSHVWFRRMYLTDGRPRQATLTVTTTGWVKVYVNACNIGTAPYYPQREDNDNRPIDITFDVTPYLNTDTNIVALLYSPTKPSVSRHQIAVRLYGTGRDCKPFSYTSDASWLCRKANSGLTPDGGEWIDGRAHNTDWNTTAYAAALWSPVTTPADPFTPSAPFTPSPPSTPSTPSSIVPAITRAITLRDPEGSGKELLLPLDAGFYGFITATLREAKRGERIRLGRLTYICSGDIDEQAWPLFTPAYWGSAIIEGDDRFKASQVTTIQALSIGSRPIFPFTPFTPSTP